MITRGDAGQENDAPTGKLLGKVIAIERDGRVISLERPGTAALQAFATQAHRLLRAGARGAKRFRTALAPAIFMIFALFLQAAPAAAQTTLTVTDAGAPNPVATGANITFTQTVKNTTATPASGASITQTTPPNTTFVSMTPPATGWTCGTMPAVGGTGTVTCTATANVAGNATLTFSLVVQAAPEAPGGSTITNNVTVNWTGPAPGGTNNGSASVTVIGADLAMTQVASTHNSCAGLDNYLYRNRHQQRPELRHHSGSLPRDAAEYDFHFHHGPSGLDVHLADGRQHGSGGLHGWFGIDEWNHDDGIYIRRDD